MTINGIWEWARNVAQKVPLETLRGKTLSIDGHIWLYESLKGCETHNQQCLNTYLITFFTPQAFQFYAGSMELRIITIQRLRELKINTIVVFDNINGSTSTSNALIDQHNFVPRKRRSFGDTPFTNLEDYVYKTSVLLTNLGVKVIISPCDGEAQCAHLETIGVTSGCITADFDYFLFGGKNLYRFDFTTNLSSPSAHLHDVTHLSIGRMIVEKKVSRPHLIATAILLGCDYFQRGVINIGIVTVFEILAEFGDDGCEDIDPHVILDRFATYVKEEIPARSEDSQRKLRLRRKKYNFPSGFPNSDSVHNAIRMYLQPSVSDDRPGPPSTVNIQKVEDILMRECGWSLDRVHKEITTSLKRSKNNTNSTNQTRINEFFPATKRMRFSPIVEPCESLDDYISANELWMQKRKSMDLSYNKQPIIPMQKKTRSKKIHARDPYPIDVIDLGNSD